MKSLPMLRYVVLCVSYLLATFSAAAQQTSHGNWVLVPIGGTRAPVDGAFGSRWVVEEYIRNTGTTPINLSNPFCPTGMCGETLKSGETVRRVGDPYHLVGLSNPEDEDRYQVSVVARDLTRQSESWGTQMPVVRERDTRPDRIELIRVPADALYRRQLRMYAIWPKLDGDASVLRVRIYSVAADLLGKSELLGEKEFFLDARQTTRNVISFHSVGNLDELFDPAKAEDVRVVVEQLSGGAKIWAFVTLTNNETQNVTVVTP